MISRIEPKAVTVFLVAVVVHLVLISAQIRNPHGQILLRTWGLAVITPLASSVSAVAGSIQGVLNRYVVLFGVQEQNEELQVEIGQLRVENAQLKEVHSMLRRGQELELLAAQYLFRTTTAGIIWKTAPFFSHRLGINAGTRHGVKKNLAIIGIEGIIGRVTATTSVSSEIELITNRGAAVGGMLTSSRLQGVLQGNGSGRLKWSFIPNYETVNVGDVIFTSGSERIYPKGLPIGRVMSSKKGKMVYRKIEVEPFIDFSRVEEVLVVLVP